MSTKLDNSTKANDTSLHPSEALQSIITSDPGKPMICHHFTPGRLGNHLFEYASILGIARTTNRSFFFPNNGQLLGNLKYPPVQNRTSAQLKARCKSAKKKWEKYLCRYDNHLLDLEKGKDYNLFDYFQSWVYFDGIQEEIRQAVTFSDEIVQSATVVISRLKTAYPNTTLVGIHNRRGDLAKKALRRHGYLTAPPEFFKKSMTYFRERFSRVLFVVLGEDSLWSAENIHPVNDDVIFLEPNSSPTVDMQILSMTDHMIRTVGTFGWWAAFKIPGRPTVVYLKDFVKKGSMLSKLYSANAQDYMLPNWIAM
ncbi:hypothetical protein V1264_011025 [Littorina saxatilis]|uniref:L-Fucosyltransferase n=2 Tax=Littorina saxatilis TaxID=31220 RepID=A0AAN9BUH0_9CAEN